MTEITHKNDVLAEAQAALDDLTTVSNHLTPVGIAAMNALATLLSYTRSLLEPLGDEGRELVGDLRTEAEVHFDVPYQEMYSRLRDAAAYIERQSPALAAKDERVRVLEEGPTVVQMGLGTIGVNWGTYHDVPAVFLEPLDHSGPVGDAMPEHLRLPKGELRKGSVIITFANKGGADVLVEDVAQARALIGGTSHE